MYVKKALALIPILAGTIFVSCSPKDTVAPSSSEVKNQRSSQTPSEKLLCSPVKEEKRCWVILPKTIFSDEDKDFQGIWHPSESDIPHLLQEARLYLEKLKKTTSWDYEREQIEEILSKWDKYACQIVGHVKDGKKMIHFNFFPKNDEFSGDWRDHYIVVFDGGADYWRIGYDCNAKEFIYFNSNGEA